MNGVKAKYLSQIKFADLDFYDDRNKALVRQFGANYHPYFVLVDGKGQTVKRWFGAVSAAEFEANFKVALAR